MNHGQALIMNEKSGSLAPPAFKKPWNYYGDLKAEIENSDRCICCLRNFLGNRRYLKRNMSLSTVLGLHIAAYSLARVDNNPWPNESVANNRFHSIQNFAVCRHCYLICSRRYNFETFSPENSEKFVHLQTHVTPEIQFGREVSQRVAQEIRNNDSAEAEAHLEENVQLQADISFPNADQAGPHSSPDSSPERPASPVYQDEDNDELMDAFFHFGLRDEGQDPDFESDSEYAPSEPEVNDPFAQQQARTCPAQWTPHKNKNYEGFKQLLVPINIDECVVCCNNVRDPTRKTFLSLRTLWDLCEYAMIQIMNNQSGHFICSSCLLENMTLSESAHTTLYYRIVANPPTARTIVVKTLCSRDGPLLLRDNVDAKEWHEVNTEKIEDRDRELRLSNTNFDNFTFSTLTESAAIHLYGCQKYQLLHIFNDYVSHHLKDGTKFKKDTKFLIFSFYIRHYLAMRAMSTIMKVSHMSISNILAEVSSALSGFIDANTSMPTHDEIIMDLTTTYCRMVHMRDDPEKLVIIADGGYSDLNAIGMSGTDSTENWSGHKHKPLRKYMTVCTSTGHILFSNTSWPGRMTDNEIMKKIFSGEEESANSLLAMIRGKKTLLICDRGFDSFKSWIELPEQAERYPLLEVIIPVNVTDNNQRYSREDVDLSRQQVTSIRDTVERVHGAQKKFLSLRYPLNLDFFRKHWLTIHMYVNAILNRFGRLNPQRPTFPDEQRYIMIHNNDMIVDTNLSDLIVEPNHDLEWKKRSTRIWREYQYDDPTLLDFFPAFTEMQLNSLNGGSYHLRKAKGYEVQIIEYLKDRKRQIVDGGGSVRTISTVSTLNTSFAMKIQVLGPSYLTRYFGDQFTACIRLDIPSFHSKYRKFKTTMLIRNVQGESPKFSFGCICSTGLRTNPCTHAIVLLYLYTYRFKHHGFPLFEQRIPL